MIGSIPQSYCSWEMLSGAVNIDRKHNVHLGDRKKNWRAFSKDSKGGWLIVSAERLACIYQIKFFTMQPVPTPFQLEAMS